MYKDRLLMAILFPVLAAALIAIYAGGLGVLFRYLEHHVWKEWAVVILGSAIVVIVPLAAALIERAVEKE